MANNTTTYFEDLNVGIPCPHQDAIPADGSKIYYRVIQKDIVDSDGFLPTPIRNDKPLPSDFDDCYARSVSVFDDLDNMLNAFFRLPHKKGRKKVICELTLIASDGQVKQSFGNPNHHSWWRSKQFDFTKVITREITIV